MPNAATAPECDRICIPTMGNLHTYGQDVKGIRELQYFYKVRTVHTPGMSSEEQTVDPRRRRRTQRRPQRGQRVVDVKASAVRGVGIGEDLHADNLRTPSGRSHRVDASRLVIESGGLVWNTPKAHEHRSVPFPAVLADEQSALMVGKDRESLVSTDQRGELLRNSSSRARALQANREEVPEGPTSLFRPTPHDLRHSAASPAISAGPTLKRSSRCSATPRRR